MFCSHLAVKTVSVHERVAWWNSKPWSGVENFGRWKVSVGQQRERSFSLQGNMNYFWKSVRAVSFLLACFAANFPMLDATKTLYIGGLFPMSGSSVASAGKIFLPVSELAIDMVNNRTDLLNGYQLQLIWNDTQCDPGHATNALFESLHTRPPMIMLLGAACSSVTRATAQIGKLWNLVQVSYASTASDLSNKEKYPMLYNIVPPDSAYNNARIAFLKHFKWKRIATIRQNSYVFDEVMDMLQEDLINNNFDLIATELFNDDPKIQVENLKKRDARIIVGMFYEDKARRVFCEAYKQEMYGEHYMWLIMDWYDNKPWWLVKDDKIDCTEGQMRMATDGYFSVDSARIISNEEPTISGMTSEKFLQTHVKPSGNNTDLYVPFVFDSMWAIALTLNKSMSEIRKTLKRSLEDFTYQDSGMAQIFKQTLKNLEFQGITGKVTFSSKREGTKPSYIKQMQNGISKILGTYHPDTDKIVLDGAQVLWKGGAPPTDGKVTIYEIQHVSTPLFCVIVILTSGGILLAAYFLRFNFVRRMQRHIKLSSPNLNNVIILGCVLIYISVYMIAIDGKLADTSTLTGLCRARGFLLSVGYSLAVGAMFSKLWRVYQIYSNFRPKEKTLKYKELICFMVVLVLIDIVVMSLWIGVDTPEIVTTDIQSQIKEEPHFRIIPQEQYCTSRYFTTWLYILLGYKALLLVIGCLIAWVTREAKVRLLNDSRYVCMSVYNIIPCALVGIPLAFLIDGHINALVACVSFFLLLPTTVTLCLLFVPKILKLKKNAEEQFRISALQCPTRNVMEVNYDSLDSSHSVNDPSADSKLQEEIATLKKEIRAIKLKHGENAIPNLSVRIADPVENGREGKSFAQLPVRLLTRPQLNKRAVTCHTTQELCVRKRRKRRSSSFSGPYLQRGSLDIGSFFSELADPLLVLKAENRELNRKLQEARISEAGKLAKVWHENAQLHHKIVELNLKSAPSEEAEKVSRLLKENAELKKQLGEVSILNSVWCDVTPQIQRKQNEDRKISKDLRELQQLLSVDLGGRRPGSFRPSPVTRPPPIGRSQSSSELHCNWNGTPCGDKKRPISPFATTAMKRFSFEGIDKRQDFCASTENPRAGTTTAEAEAVKSLTIVSESPQAVISETRSTGKAPSIIRRDNIDGCKSEKETSGIGKGANMGFSSDEDEDIIHLKSVNKMDENLEKSSIFNHEKEDVMISSQNAIPKIVRQDRLFSSEPKDQSISDPKSNSYCESSDESVQNGFGVETSRVVLDENDNLQSTVILLNPLVADDFDTNQEFPAEIKNFSGQTEEKVELSDSKTLDSSVHEANPTRTQKASYDRSAKDFPAYMRKVQRKKEKKKNDKIEKIFFV